MLFGFYNPSGSSPGRSRALCLLMMLTMGGTATLWLWNDHVTERRAKREAWISRSRAFLDILECALQSHRRLSNEFIENLDTILEDASAAPGIAGLAITDPGGAHIARAGEMPAILKPSSEAQWTTAGLLMSRETLIVDEEQMALLIQEWTDAARRGEGGGGPGLGPGLGGGLGGGPGGGLLNRIGRAGRRPPDDRAARRPPALDIDPPRREAWLSLLLDDRPLQQDLDHLSQQFRVKVWVAWTLSIIGAALLYLIMRQGRLAAELNVARTRESRLEEMARLGAGLAHETKNPLSLIRGLAQSWIRRPESSDISRGQAQQIVDEVDRVVGRINSFLDYARPPAPDRAEIDLGALLSGTAELFRDEATAKGVRLEVETPDLKASADADMVRQILVNLLANALAACRRGDFIRVLLERDGAQFLRFAVVDSGSGIAPEDLPQVTKPYFSRRAGGTGLGLAIVDQIVRAHGWKLEISSPPGKGAEARVTLIEEVSAA